MRSCRVVAQRSRSGDDMRLMERMLRRMISRKAMWRCFCFSSLLLCPRNPLENMENSGSCLLMLSFMTICYCNCHDVFGNYLDVFCEMLPSLHFLTILCPVELRFRICSVPVWIPTLPGGAWPGVRFHGLRLSRSSHVAGRTFPVLIAGTAFSRCETLSILSLWSSE